MNNSKISVLLSCLLIISLCFSLVGCGGSSLEDSSSNDSLETDVIEEDIVMTDTVLYDEPISDDIIIDNLVYDDNVYECKINDNIICRVAPLPKKLAFDNAAYYAEGRILARQENYTY